MKNFINFIFLFIPFCIPNIFLFAQNPYPIIPIDSVQFVNYGKLSSTDTTTFPDYISPTFKNTIYRDTVRFEGIVVSNPKAYGLSTSRKAAYIQRKGGGQWSGVIVMCEPNGTGTNLANLNAETKFFDNFNVGYKVRVTAVITDFQGETQLNLIRNNPNWNNSIEQLSLISDTLVYSEITADKLMRGNPNELPRIPQKLTAEAYEGTLVRLRNLTVYEVSVSGNRTTWSVIDDNGNVIDIRDFSAYYRRDANGDSTGLNVVNPNRFIAPAIGTRLEYLQGVVTEYKVAGLNRYGISPIYPGDFKICNLCPPMIKFISKSPSIIKSSDTTKLTFEISTGDTALANSKVYFKNSVTNTMDSLSLNPITNFPNYYLAQLPPTNAGGCTISYWVKATDKKNRTTIFPDSFNFGNKIYVDNYITIDTTNKKQFCSNKIQNSSISYKLEEKQLQFGNVFRIELSDTSGSFTTPTVIGTKTDSSSIGSIPIIIPTGLLINKNYKIRIKCSADSFINSPPFSITIVSGFNTPIISSSKDSFCKGTGTFFAVTPNNTNLNFKWLRNNLLLSDETNDSLFADSTCFYRAIVNNNTCSDTSNTIGLRVFPNPKVGFTINNPIQCLNGNNFLFNDTSTISSGTINRKWNLGYGNLDTSLLANPTKVYPEAYTYVVKLAQISNKGCSDSISKIILVNPKPLVGFTTNNMNQCIYDNNFLFTDTSTISNGNSFRKWNLGTGNNDTSAQEIENKVYSLANTYSIKLLVTSYNGCKDSIIKTITVHAKPIVGFSTNNMHQCLSNNNFLFTDTSNISSEFGTKRLWKLSTNDTSTNLSFTKAFASSGNYTIKLIEESNYGCIDSLTKNISVTQLIANTNSVKNNICGANGNGTASILVSNGTMPYTYLWDSIANNQTTQTAIGLNKNTYQVIVTDSNNCTISKNVSVLNTPNINTQVPITNVAMLDQTLSNEFSQYYNYDLPLNINSNPSNLENFADVGKYFRFKIQSENKKTNGQSIVNGFCKLRSNSPYLTITDSLSALNNIAYNGKVWSADEFEVYINPTTPKGSNLYFDFIVEESGNQFNSGCLSIPIIPLDYSQNNSLTVDDDNNPDSHGNDNDTCELGEAIEFYPWLNNISDKNAQYVKGNLLNSKNFSGVNVWNNIKGVNDTVLNSTWWNFAFGRPSSIISGTNESKPAMDFVFDYGYGAPKNNFDLNMAVSAGFKLLSDTTLSLVRWSLPYSFKSEIGVTDELQIKPIVINCTSIGGTRTLGISCNRSWVVTSNQSWVKLNKTIGIGDDSLIVNIEANSGLNRTALLTFTAGLVTKTISINQDSLTMVDVLELDKDSIRTSFGASLNTVLVSSNRSWIISSNQSWCGVSTLIGSGNGSFNVMNSVNNTGLLRNAKITVIAGGVTKNVYVEQSPSLGFEEVKNDFFFQVYPNPNSGNFTLRTNNEKSNITNISLVNMLGKEVWNTSSIIPSGMHETTINANLNKGIYLLRFQNEKVNKIKYIVVE